jgi:hypothetical protein
MKRGNLLVLAGGILGVVAVFLPFYWTSPEVGVFGPGISLLSGVQLYFQMLGSLNPFQLQPILSVVTILLEPAGAVLMIAAGGLASRAGRAASVWGLAGAVLGLSFLLWHLTVIFNLYYYPPPYAMKPLQFFGSGYWLALIGGVLGMIGVLLGLWRKSTLWTPMPQPQDAPSSGGRAPRVSPGALLVLAGALVALVSFFLPAFAPWSGSPSQWDLLRRAGGIIWPDALAIVLLVGVRRSRSRVGTGRIWGAWPGRWSGCPSWSHCRPHFCQIRAAGCSISLQGRPTGSRSLAACWASCERCWDCRRRQQRP